MRLLFIFISLCISFSSLSSQLVIKDGEAVITTLSHEVLVQDLAKHNFTTHLPWVEGEALFAGFTVSSLLTYLNIEDAFSISFVALNDYASSSTISDIQKYQPIVAYEMNNKKMKVRNKGPYWLVYNLSEHPEIDKGAYHAQMVWQIDEIIIHRTEDNADK